MQSVPIHQKRTPHDQTHSLQLSAVRLHQQDSMVCSHLGLGKVHPHTQHAWRSPHAKGTLCRLLLQRLPQGAASLWYGPVKGQLDMTAWVVRISCVVHVVQAPAPAPAARCCLLVVRSCQGATRHDCMVGAHLMRRARCAGSCSSACRRLSATASSCCCSVSMSASAPRGLAATGDAACMITDI